MKTPHVHAELIKAWADGAEIESLTIHDWKDCFQPRWSPSCEYRIKPEPKPDVVLYAVAYIDMQPLSPPTKGRFDSDNLKLTFDGETLKLKSAEVL